MYFGTMHKEGCIHGKILPQLNKKRRKEDLREWHRKSQEDRGGDMYFHKYFAKPQMKRKHRWVDDSARICSVSHKGKLPFSSIYRVEEIKTTILYFFGITENISYTQTGTALCLIFLVSFPKVWHFPSKVCNSMVLKHTQKIALPITCNWKLTTSWCQAIMRQSLSNMQYKF